MKQFLLTLLCLAGIAGPELTAQPAPGQALQTLLDALPGVYAGDAPDPRASDGRSQRIFHRIRPIDAPQFGAQVMYYRLSTGSADAPALQQKIFSFETAGSDGAVRMRAWAFPPDYPDQLAHTTADEWQSLTATELLDFPEACAFAWRTIAGGYEGVVDAGHCEFASPAFGQRVRPQMSYRLSGDRLEWTEVLYGEAGNVLVSTSGTLPAFRQPGLQP